MTRWSLINIAHRISNSWKLLSERDRGKHSRRKFLSAICPWAKWNRRIRKTCPCNDYPLKPHFYTVKLGFAGVYLFFLFLLQNIDCGELLTIRTLANSALVNSALVNSDLNHWSIRTSTTGQFGPFSVGQFGPQKKRKSLVNSDLFYWSIQTFPLVNSDLFHWSVVNSDLILWSVRTFSIGQFWP